jgi:hypothetical protein
MPITTDHRNLISTPSSAEAKISLSNVDEDAISSLASELRETVDLVAEIYTRELARLATHARVKAFLPLLVGRLVRRRSAEERRSSEAAIATH